MFRGMTIGEQRTLFALLAVIGVGLAYHAYRNRAAPGPVYRIPAAESAAAEAPANVLAFKASIPTASPTPAPISVATPRPSPRQIVAPLPAAATDPECIDLNTATLEQLESLHGIGPVRGRNILEYRSRNGPFHSIQDLRNIKGIGPKTIESIRPHVIVSR